MRFNFTRMRLLEDGTRIFVLPKVRERGVYNSNIEARSSLGILSPL